MGSGILMKKRLGIFSSLKLTFFFLFASGRIDFSFEILSHAVQAVLM